MDDPSGPRERNNDDMLKRKDMIFDDIVSELTQTLNMSPTDITVDLSLRNDLILEPLDDNNGIYYCKVTELNITFDCSTSYSNNQNPMF